MKLKRKEYKRIIRALLSERGEASEAARRHAENTKQYEKSMAIKHRSDQDQRMLEGQALLLEQQREEIAELKQSTGEMVLQLAESGRMISDYQAEVYDLESKLEQSKQLYIDLQSTPDKEYRYHLKPRAGFDKIPTTPDKSRD